MGEGTALVMMSKLNKLQEENEYLRKILNNILTNSIDSYACDYCTHYISCPVPSSSCPGYSEGKQLYDIENQHFIDFPWTCQDFNFGDCDILSSYCKGCVEENFKNFELKMFS